MTAERTAETYRYVIRDAGRADFAAEIAQIETVLTLVEQMAGMTASAARSDAQSLAAAYASAPAVARRGFRTLLGEATRIATTGAGALIDQDRPSAAAAPLAATLRMQLARLEASVGA